MLDLQTYIPDSDAMLAKIAPGGHFDRAAWRRELAVFKLTPGADLAERRHMDPAETENEWRWASGCIHRQWINELSKAAQAKSDKAKVERLRRAARIVKDILKQRS